MKSPLQKRNIRSKPSPTSVTHIFTILLLSFTLGGQPVLSLQQKDLYKCSIYLKEEGLAFNIGDANIRNSYHKPIKVSGSPKEGVLSFNFCSPASTPDNSTCQNNREFLSFYEVDSPSQQCTPLTNSDTLVKYSYTTKDKNSETGTASYLSVYYNNSKRESPPIDYDIEYRFECSAKNLGKNKVTSEYISPTSSSLITKMTSNTDIGGQLGTEDPIKRGYFLVRVVGDAGCSNNISRIFVYLEDNYLIFGFLFVLTGFFLVIYGSRHAKTGIAVFGFFSGFMTTLFAFLIFWNYRKASIEEDILIYGFCIFLGSITCAVLYYYYRASIFYTCPYLGLFFSSILLALLEKIFGDNLSIYLELSVVLLVLLTTTAIGFLAGVHGVVVSHALIGGFLSIKGAGLLIGIFPSELLVMRRLRHGDVGSFNWTWWVYVGVLFLGSTFSVVLQYVLLKAKKDHKL